MGRPTYLTADEEALVVASTEMKGAHSAPINRKMIGTQLSKIVSTLNLTKLERDVQVKSNLAYARKVIRRVNAKEEDMEGQKRKSRTGEIKVAGLSNKRAKQSDPILAWLMFHSICRMYRHMRNKRYA
jgi:hypothetical protein